MCVCVCVHAGVHITVYVCVGIHRKINGKLVFLWNETPHTTVAPPSISRKQPMNLYGYNQMNANYHTMFPIILKSGYFGKYVR